MEHSVQNGVGERGVAEGVVPVIGGQLTGNNQRAGAVSIVDEFEQILGLGAVEFL